MTPEQRQRFDAKISPEPTSGCWLWTGAIMNTGYAGFSMPDHKTVRAHRVAYELHVGPLPVGRDLDHRCHNRACVNPAHLRVATRRENASNLRDKYSASSRFTGVSWHVANRRWQATIRIEGRKRHLGYFSDEPAAAQAYREALLLYAVPNTEAGPK